MLDPNFILALFIVSFISICIFKLFSVSYGIEKGKEKTRFDSLVINYFINTWIKRNKNEILKDGSLDPKRWSKFLKSQLYSDPGSTLKNKIEPINVLEYMDIEEVDKILNDGPSKEN